MFVNVHVDITNKKNILSNGKVTSYTFQGNGMKYKRKNNLHILYQRKYENTNSKGSWFLYPNQGREYFRYHVETEHHNKIYDDISGYIGHRNC